MNDVNYFTVDLEDYFMVSAFKDIVPAGDWDFHEFRAGRSMGHLLDLLDEGGARATVFVVGWIAERFPSLVREIRGRGHEVACHSFRHRLIYDMTPDEFREDTRQAKVAIESAIGEPIIGYRAPSYSITRQSMWALDILREEGFLYDSSVYPVLHDRYGVPGYDRFPGFAPEPEGNGGRGLLEIPLSTVKFLGHNVPFGGGGYLRLYPYGLTRFFAERVNHKEDQPFIVYVHPWEIDTGQPRFRGSPLSMFRHYVNIDRNEEKIRNLLRDFRFSPLAELYHKCAGKQ